jgi:hypothetical protein
MQLLKLVFTVIRRCILVLLLLYWFIFIFDSAIKLITGGPDRVLDWYQHIGTQVLPDDSQTSQSGSVSFRIRPFTWTKFFIDQAALAGITMLLLWPERRALLRKKIRTQQRLTSS